MTLAMRNLEVETPRFPGSFHMTIPANIRSSALELECRRCGLIGIVRAKVDEGLLFLFVYINDQTTRRYLLGYKLSRLQVFDHEQLV